MPAGNITQYERLQRMIEVKGLLEDGLSDSEIADQLQMPIATVRRNIKYVQQLELADLSPEEVSKRRSEIYLELVDATAEAKKLFDVYKETGEPIHAKYFFNSWLQALELRAKLFGLTNARIDVNTQINQISTYEPSSADKIPQQQAQTIRNAIIGAHEKKVRDATG